MHVATFSGVRRTCSFPPKEGCSPGHSAAFIKCLLHLIPLFSTHRRHPFQIIRCPGSPTTSIFRSPTLWLYRKNAGERTLPGARTGPGWLWQPPCEKKKTVLKSFHWVFAHGTAIAHCAKARTNETQQTSNNRWMTVSALFTTHL